MKALILVLRRIGTLVGGYMFLVGCGSSSETQVTTNEVTYETQSAMCTRFSACNPNLAPTPTACINTITYPTADEPSKCTDAQLDQCLADIQNEGCDDVTIAVFPSSCDCQ